MLIIVVAMRARCDDSRIGLRDCGDALVALNDPAAILVDAHIQIAELKDVGLGGRKLEGYQARNGRTVLYLTDILGAWPSRQTAVGVDDEVLDLLCSRAVLRQVGATMKTGRELTCREGSECRRRLRH